MFINSLELNIFLTVIYVKKYLALASITQLVGAWSHTQKGVVGSIPRFQVLPLIRVPMGGNQSMLLSLCPSPTLSLPPSSSPFPLSSSSKKI